MIINPHAKRLLENRLWERKVKVEIYRSPAMEQLNKEKKAIKKEMKRVHQQIQREFKEQAAVAKMKRLLTG